MTNENNPQVGSCPVCLGVCQIIKEDDGVKYVNLKVPSSEIQDAVGAILSALGLPECARPYSTKDVIYRDIIPAIEKLRAK